MALSIIEAALAYAARGWYVIPVRRDKTPLTKNGQKDGTTDADVIRAWWEKWPRANVAVVCAPSGLCVIDVDVRPEGSGMPAWREREQEHGEDQTPNAITGSGGLHIY